MTVRRLNHLALLGAGFLLAACAGDPAQNPAWELAGHPGLLYDVKLFYERNALEEDGRCTMPLLEGVTRSEILSEDDEQLVLGLTYRYRDVIRDERRLGLFRECEGYASRTFTIAKTGDELRVVGMGGPQKRRGAPAASVQQ